MNDMTTHITTTPTHDTAARVSRTSAWLRRAAAEPLLHFLLAGSLIFALDQALLRRRGDPQAITVSTDVATQARELFKASMKRDPGAAEMKTLLDRWIDNEVLYREGLALGLDRGDSAVRERIIFKALSVTQAGISLPKVDEAGLRGWFERNRPRYDLPTRLDFFEAVLAVDEQDRTPQRVRAFVDALNGRGDSDAQSGLRVFKDRPRPHVLQTYGPEFTTALEALTPGTWAALPGREGLRVVRLETIKRGAAASFEERKEQIYQDWKDDVVGRATTQAIRDIGKKYAVRYEAGVAATAVAAVAP